MNKKLVIAGILLFSMVVPTVTSAAPAPLYWNYPGWDGRDFVDFIWSKARLALILANLHTLQIADLYAKVHTALLTALYHAGVDDGSITTAKLANDAVTDTKVVNTITAANYLPLAGGTMAGVLNMGNQNIIGVGTVTFSNGETLDNATDGVVTIKTDNTADWSAAKLRLYSRGNFHYAELKNINYPEGASPTSDMMVTKNTSGLFTWQAVADADDSNFFQRRVPDGDNYNWYLDSQPILWDFNSGTTYTPGITLAIKDNEGTGWQVAGVNPTLRIAKADGTQYSTLDYSTLTLGSGVSTTSGAGAPVGACTTGSLYLRTDGGANTTLYVCEAGAWAAK